jgi:hypothetical protein
MPKMRANNITLNYEQQGSGEPLILIPYLAADHACYAFQVAEYAKQFPSKGKPSAMPGKASAMTETLRAMEGSIACRVVGVRTQK